MRIEGDESRKASASELYKWGESSHEIYEGAVGACGFTWNSHLVGLCSSPVKPLRLDDHAVLRTTARVHGATDPQKLMFMSRQKLAFLSLAFGLRFRRDKFAACRPISTQDTVCVQLFLDQGSPSFAIRSYMRSILQAVYIRWCGPPRRVVGTWISQCWATCI